MSTWPPKYKMSSRKAKRVRKREIARRRKQRKAEKKARVCA